MSRNLGRVDQILRSMFGLALLAYTAKDGTLAPGFVVAGVIGMVLLVRAFFSYCPLYALFGISTRSRLDQLT